MEIGLFFQGFHHHCFANEGCSGEVEVCVSWVQCDIEVRQDECAVLEEGRLLDLDMLLCDRDAPVARGQFSMIACFPGIVPRKLETASCGGVGVDVIKSLDRSPNSEVVVHCPFYVKSLNLKKLLRKPIHGLMSRFDMLANLKSLLARLILTVDVK